MRVKDVMSWPVSFCTPETDAAAAAELMWNQDCGVLPVVGPEGHAVGIVTARDLFVALRTTNRRAADLPVSEIMKTELAVCAPEDDTRIVLRKMTERRLHRLPVVDASGVLQGVISVDDIVLRGEHGVPGEELITAIDQVLARHRIPSGSPLGMREPPMMKPPDPPREGGSDLTPRQRQILKLLAEGRTMKEIAGVLHISPRTVEFHKYSIMEVLRARTVADLIRYATKQGIVA